METNYSFHAFKRVYGRISMTHKELAEILDAGLALNIGQENKSNRVHKLFYSARDKMCFVAIQDIKTGTVVTVLPIDYHQNIAWEISIEAQKKAQKLVIKSPVESYSDNYEILNTNATVFRISGNIVDKYGKYKKTFNIGSWPCLPYDYRVDDLVEDDKFKKFLIEKIEGKARKMNDDMSFVRSIAIKIGSKGEPDFFSVSDIIEVNA